MCARARAPHEHAGTGTDVKQPAAKTGEVAAGTKKTPEATQAGGTQQQQQEPAKKPEQQQAAAGGGGTTTTTTTQQPATTATATGGTTVAKPATDPKTGLTNLDLLYRPTRCGWQCSRRQPLRAARVSCRGERIASWTQQQESCSSGWSPVWEGPLRGPEQPVATRVHGALAWARLAASRDAAHAQVRALPRRLRRREMVQKIAQNGYLVVTWANWHYQDFVRTWVYHVRKVGITGYIVGAMDEHLLQVRGAGRGGCAFLELVWSSGLLDEHLLQVRGPWGGRATLQSRAE